MPWNLVPGSCTLWRSADDTNDTLAGKVTKLNKNMTEEEVQLLSLNKTIRAKMLAAKSG